MSKLNIVMETGSSSGNTIATTLGTTKKTRGMYTNSVFVDVGAHGVCQDRFSSAAHTSVQRGHLMRRCLPSLPLRMCLSCRWIVSLPDAMLCLVCEHGFRAMMPLLRHHLNILGLRSIPRLQSTTFAERCVPRRCPAYALWSAPSEARPRSSETSSRPPPTKTSGLTLKSFNLERSFLRTIRQAVMSSTWAFAVALKKDFVRRQHLVEDRPRGLPVQVL